MKQLRPRFSLFALTALLAAGASACAQPLRLEEPFAPPTPTPPGAPFRLAAGSEFEVEYCRRFEPVAEYLLGVGDRIRITVHPLPELNADTLIAPDGTVSFHRVGTLPAQGRSVEELRRALQDGLASHYPEPPEVTVILLESDARTERFVDMLLRSGEGAVRAVTLGPNGSASLPGIGAVDFTGLELAAAERALNARLQASYPSLQVVLNADGRVPAKFSVLGEVERPGLFDLVSETTLVEALAGAGGETEYGDLARVLLMSRTADGGVEGTLYSLTDAFAHGNSLPMVRMRAGDTLLVLPTGVRDVNRFIEQYVVRNLPIRVGANYQLNQPSR